MEEETRAGRSASPELPTQAVRPREQSAETEREYVQLMRHLARKYAERPDLASAFLLLGHSEEEDGDG